MDMRDIERKMEVEMEAEREDFARKFLKSKRENLERLEKQREALDLEIEEAEDEYDEILAMSINYVYDKYKRVNITGTATLVFGDPNILADWTNK